MHEEGKSSLHMLVLKPCIVRKSLDPVKSLVLPFPPTLPLSLSVLCFGSSSYRADSSQPIAHDHVALLLKLIVCHTASHPKPVTSASWTSADDAVTAVRGQQEWHHLPFFPSPRSLPLAPPFFFLFNQ